MPAAAVCPIVLFELAADAKRPSCALPIPKAMRKRGLQLLEAHIRSFDPGVPTARERLEAELGEEFTQQLLRVLLSARTRTERPRGMDGR
jgi:hypothetical protein